MYLLWLLPITLSLIQAEGFLPDTLLWTADGLKSVEQITIDDQLMGQESNQPIVHIFHKTVASYVQFTVNQEVISCATSQLFWCANKDCWQKAVDLVIGDQLLTIDNQLIALSVIEFVTQSASVYAFTVGPPHVLFVGTSGIVSHNIVPAIGVGLLWALGGSGAIEFVGATFYIGIVTAGVFIGTHFFKEKKKQAACKLTITSQSNGSPSFNPNNNDDDKEKHPHGKYVDADYHHAGSKGIKSPSPKNGQKALDKSVPIKNNNTQRVSVVDEEIVILKRIAPREYHGYVTTWEELNAGGNKTTEAIKSTLLQHKMVRGNGKIII